MSSDVSAACQSVSAWYVTTQFRCEIKVAIKYYFRTFTWAFMLPLTAIVYSCVSIASVIGKSEHRVNRGVIISVERSNVFQSRAII